MSKSVRTQVYEFEYFRLDAAQLLLSHDGEEISLPPKAIEILLVLVEHRGTVVSKDYLLETVWQDVIVEESNLYGYLHLLRNALGDQKNGKPFVETLRRRGYRFNGAVSVSQHHNSLATTTRVEVQDDRVAESGIANLNSQLLDRGRKRNARVIIGSAVLAIGIVVLAASAFFYVGKPRSVTDRDLTKSEEAYALYREGYDLAQRLTPENYKLAITRFEEAIKLDPDYPSPYVGIATANRVNMLSADARPLDRVSIGNGKLAAQKAIALAPDLPEAHIALGMITFFYDWDWKTAEKQLTRGYELNPDLEDTNIELAHFYSNMGRHEDAIRLSTRARQLDPLVDRSQALHGMILFYAGRYDEAIEHLRTRIGFKSDFWFYHFNLQRPYLQKGLNKEAIDEGELAKQYGCPSLELIVQRAYAHVRMGDTKRAEEALVELNEIAERDYVGPYLLALAHNVLGHTDQALILLDQAFKVKDWRMTFLKVDPRWNNLRSDPRFLQQMKNMNFE